MILINIISKKIQRQKISKFFNRAEMLHVFVNELKRHFVVYFIVFY